MPPFSLSICLILSMMIKCAGVLLTICLLRNLHAFLLCADFFSKSIFFFEKLFEDYHQSVMQFRSRPGQTFCRTWSGSNLFAKQTTLVSKELSPNFPSLSAKSAIPLSGSMICFPDSAMSVDQFPVFLFGSG